MADAPGSRSHADTGAQTPAPRQGQQAPLPGMPQKLVTITPSRLNAFEDCPRRYRYAYVDRPAPPKGPPWAHNSLGASVHQALRSWYDLAPGERRPAALPTLLATAWVSDGYRDEEQERAVWRRALDWVERYAADGHLPAEPAGVERGVAARTSVVAFHGRTDRIDTRDDGELAVVDYKTGRTPVDEDEARGSAALALYAYATAHTLRRPCRQVELHHLPTGTVAAAELTEDSVARQVRRAEATAADIRAAQQAVTDGADPDDAFPAQPGARCGWCDYRRACPAGRDFPGKDPWTAVAAVAAPDT